MLQRSRELILSLVAIVFITITYLLVTFIFQDSPSSSGFFGHSLGIFGFLLMVMTETLYTLRKQSHSARWGRMSDWLEFHIFTGLVGPYMVILHSAWHFNGLAGVLTLLTVIIVISGFIGRYIYTAVPRTVNGVEISMEELSAQAAMLEEQLARLASNDLTGQTPAAGYLAQPKGGGTLVPGDGWDGLSADSGKRNSPQDLHGLSRASAHQYKYLRRKRDQIRRQINSQSSARQMLAIWHLVHVPLGLTLFILAIIHTVAAIYYSVLMR